MMKTSDELVLRILFRNEFNAEKHAKGYDAITSIQYFLEKEKCVKGGER